MTAKLTVDQAGRILIPKPLRNKLHLGPADILQLESEGDQITLRPVRAKAWLHKKRGLWVYRGEPTDASIVEVIDQIRKKRLRDLIG
jgi:AbrB family looped-hinge helix DNA binding protein